MRWQPKRRIAPLAHSFLLVAAIGVGCSTVDDRDLSGAESSNVPGEGCVGKCDGWGNGTIPVIPLASADGADFFVLADGTNLKDFDSEGLLVRRTGTDQSFTSSAQSQYERLKADDRMHWIVRDLDSDAPNIAQSGNAHDNVYGASVAKALVVGALLWKTQGQLDGPTWAQAIRLIGRSDNSAWTPLEKLAGGNDGMRAFVEAMGYEKTVAHRNSGNQLSALELAEFLYDMHHRRFAGADALYKLMSGCRTGATRARKYVPASVVMGGKTGSWRNWVHDMRFVEVGSKRYAIVVLSTGGSSENVALMFGGLVREYVLGTLDLPEVEPNQGWIGGACETPADCSHLGPEALCFSEAQDGVLGGHCSLACTRYCPDRAGANAATYCVASEPGSGAGYCHGQCDFRLYSGSGCRDGYSCQPASRPASDGNTTVCQNLEACTESGQTDESGCRCVCLANE